MIPENALVEQQRCGQWLCLSLPCLSDTSISTFQELSCTLLCNSDQSCEPLKLELLDPPVETLSKSPQSLIHQFTTAKHLLCYVANHLNAPDKSL